jgi:hypothetical protein
MATARQWQWTISKWKNMGLTSEQALAQAADDNERSIATLMARYEERLAAYQSVDFDDLIGMPLKLLRDFPEVRAKWQALLGHVLVDEYQDTNATQYELLKLLVGERATSPPWATTTSPSTAGAAPRWTTSRNCRWTTRAQGHQAGAELPLHQRHPARGQQRDRAQPQAVSQDPVQRAGRGRAGARGRCRQRRARSRARRGPHPEPARRQQPAACDWKELRHPVPRQPPGQAV